jgi:uncharacterized membrane protein YeaQ/YmgE (transglycosylase-associated protein family)
MNYINSLLEKSLGMDLASLLLIVIVGFAIGIVARVLMPGRDPAGLITTSLLGIGGSFLGHWGASRFGLFSSKLATGDTAMFFQFGVAVAGAMTILLLLKVLRKA